MSTQLSKNRWHRYRKVVEEVKSSSSEICKARWWNPLTLKGVLAGFHSYHKVLERRLVLLEQVTSMHTLYFPCSYVIKRSLYILLSKPSVPYNWCKKSGFHKSKGALYNYTQKPSLKPHLQGFLLYCPYAHWVLTFCPLFPPTGIHHPVWSLAHLQPPDGVRRQGTPGASGLFPRGLAAVWTALLHPKPCLHRPGRWHK